MANHALATLESALRARKLDRTLTTALPPLDRHDPSALIPTGVSGLDAWLHPSTSAQGGGLPRGQVSELAGPCSSGRTTVLLQMIAAVTQRGELAALVDTCDSLDVGSAVAAGIDVDRMLWIRGDSGSLSPAGFSGPGSIDRVVDRALKALNLVLQAGGFALAVIDLADVPPLVLKRLPFTTWLRVQRSIEGSDTACVLVVPEPLARSAGGLTLTLAGRTTWAVAGDRNHRLTGMDAGVRVISPRRRIDGECRVRFAESL